MATCEVCENEYDKAFEVVVGAKHDTFDSFECAIHALAPVCPHCNCRIAGHGVEADGQIYCFVHCARTAGKTQLKTASEPYTEGNAGSWDSAVLVPGDYF